MSGCSGAASDEPGLGPDGYQLAHEAGMGASGKARSWCGVSNADYSTAFIRCSGMDGHAAAHSELLLRRLLEVLIQ